MELFFQVKSGVVLNIVCVLVLQLAVNTWGYAFYDLGTYPVWAGGQVGGPNATEILNTTLSSALS